MELAEAMDVCEIYHVHEMIKHLACHKSRLVVKVLKHSRLALSGFKRVALLLVALLGFDKLREEINVEVHNVHYLWRHNIPSIRFQFIYTFTYLLERYAWHQTVAYGFTDRASELPKNKAGHLLLVVVFILCLLL